MLNVYLLKDFEYLIYPEHCDRWCKLKIVSHFNTMPRVKESKGECMNKNSVAGPRREELIRAQWRLSAGSGI